MDFASSRHKYRDCVIIVTLSGASSHRVKFRMVRSYRVAHGFVRDTDGETLGRKIYPYLQQYQSMFGPSQELTMTDRNVGGSYSFQADDCDN